MAFEDMTKDELLRVVNQVVRCMEGRLDDERVNYKTSDNSAAKMASYGYMSCAGFVLDIIHGTHTSYHLKNAIGE